MSQEYKRNLGIAENKGTVCVLVLLFDFEFPPYSLSLYFLSSSQHPAFKYRISLSDQSRERDPVATPTR